MHLTDALRLPLQRLSHEVGWGYKDVVDRLEEKRKTKATAFHDRKVCSTDYHQLYSYLLTVMLPLIQVANAKLRASATSGASDINEKLATLGH